MIFAPRYFLSLDVWQTNGSEIYYFFPDLIYDKIKTFVIAS